MTLLSLNAEHSCDPLPQWLCRFIQKLETDALKQLKLVGAADLQAAEEAERNAIENDKKDIETGGRKGYRALSF